MHHFILKICLSSNCDSLTISLWHGTIHFSESSMRATPSDNFGSKISNTKHFFIEKAKIDEPMSSTNGSPKFVALKIWKILLPTAGQTIWSNAQT